MMTESCECAVGGSLEFHRYLHLKKKQQKTNKQKKTKKKKKNIQGDLVKLLQVKTNIS